MPGRSQPGAVNAPGVAATNRFPSAFVPKPMFQNARRYLTPRYQQQQSGIIDATTNGQCFDLTRDDGGEVPPPTWPTTPSVHVPSAPTKRKRHSSEEDEVPKVPKKRGRPPKAKPVCEVQVPKKRGRPPKAKPVVVVQEQTPDTTTTTTNSSLEENYTFEAAPFAVFNEYTIDERVEAGTPCRLQERGQDSIEAVETVDNLPGRDDMELLFGGGDMVDATDPSWFSIMDMAPADDLPAYFSPTYPAAESIWADPPLPQEPCIVEQNSAKDLMDARDAAAAADDGLANAITYDFLCDWNGNNLEDLIF